MRDHDRRAIINRAHTLLDRLDTEPGGLTDLLAAIRQAQPGARSANLEPHGGARYETVPMPYGDDHRQIDTRVPVRQGDPTGEAGSGPRDQALVAEDELDRDLATLRRLIDRMNDRYNEWTRRARHTGPLGDEWCMSCHRDNQHCEPVSDRYKGLCRWCGDFKGAEGILPPLPLLQARHRGQRITQDMVRRHRKRAS